MSCNMLKLITNSSRSMKFSMIYQVRNCSKSTSSSPSETEIPYNSPATPAEPKEPVGPGASKSGEYKNPEYFCYNDVSYYDLEAEMKDMRLPQPNAENDLY